MAQPTKGFTKASNPQANGTSVTISNVSVNSGNNRLLVLQLTTSNQRDHNSVTYGGVAMTRKTHIARNGLASRMSFWYLENPTVGTANAVITFSGGLYVTISTFFHAFTDSGGVGGHVLSGGNTSPRTGNITVEQDSLIMVTACSGASVQTLQIPTGTNRPFTTHNTGKQVGTGAISASGHNAGAISTTSTASNNITLDRFEIKGLGGSGSSRRRIIIC